MPMYLLNGTRDEALDRLQSGETVQRPTPRGRVSAYRVGLSADESAGFEVVETDRSGRVVWTASGTSGIARTPEAAMTLLDRQADR